MGDTSSRHQVEHAVEQAVAGAQLHLAVSELVDIAAALEAEMLEHLHWCLLRQDAEVEQPGFGNHVVGQVLFVYRNKYL